MKIFNLTTLFTTTPLNNVASAHQIDISSNGLKAFQPAFSSGVDSYTTNPLLRQVTDVNNLEKAMQSKDVQAILQENGLPNKLNPKALSSIASHSQKTRILAAKIASNLN